VHRWSNSAPLSRQNRLRLISDAWIQISNGWKTNMNSNLKFEARKSELRLTILLTGVNRAYLFVCLIDGWTSVTAHHCDWLNDHVNVFLHSAHVVWSPFLSLSTCLCHGCLAHSFWAVIMQVCLMPCCPPHLSCQSNRPTMANRQTWNHNKSICSSQCQM